MVSRKPVADNLVPKPLSQAINNPPYPISPTEDHAPMSQSPATETQDITLHNASASPETPASTLETLKQLHEQTDPKQNQSDSDDDHEWDSDFEEIDVDEAPRKHDLPAALKVGGLASPRPQPGSLPSTLRVGPPEGVPKIFRESPDPTPPLVEPSSYTASTTSSQGLPLQSHNPYLSYQSTGQSSVSSKDGLAQPIKTGMAATNPWAASLAAVELPSQRTPVEEVSRLSMSGLEVHDADDSPGTSHAPIIPSRAEEQLKRQNSSPWDPGMDISSLDAFSSRNHRLPSTQENDENPQTRTWQEQQDWERREREKQQMELAAAAERAQKRQAEQNAEDEWFRGEAAFSASHSAHQPSLLDQALPLPPRNDAGPIRPHVNTDGQPTSRPEIETPSTRSQRQRKEHYQIKHMRWYDAKKQGFRPAPILTQNTNGPCPLLGLVNALVLSTPHGEETALIETLRTREQVSLGLLLDAVFDELMSGRRGDAAQQLPDVGDLYSFLVTLHTGMNVNPRFVKADGAPTRAPSGFESTKELRMYSTFNIPLIHGWLPPSESRAYAAFDRIAQTYEDAQNVQFHEEELETKLQAQGLTPQEQDMFQDLQSIKDFFRTWPTQLTEYGLDVITQNIKPGQVAILFRNDHFSTLYKEPRTGRIFTLVTDAGYSRHEEIVWESLVDVHGRGSELFSGDFRPVGNMSDANTVSNEAEERPIRSLLDADDDQGWQAVRNNRSGQPRPQDPAPLTGSTIEPTAGSPPAASTEQEDHDLALALQLQEEEEDRHRRDLAARRRRENELSEQFISSSNGRDGTGASPAGLGGPQIRPMIPPRRTHNNNGGNGAVSAPSDGHEDAPPPTYEQAAAGRPYNPPRTHPASAHAPIQPARPVATNQSAYTQASGVGGRRRASGPGLISQVPGSRLPGRRPMSSVGPNQLGQGHAATGEDREKCIVM
ncbi:hypothetical protein EJ05DRAFT_539897 [Pseudovirgaria hyperparasitica]|uniref:MINDY deubiquitinase domain-containing protein n=1 Tax=Pseudovirgaria hyperparasitica TaxID=470096 RepID=A0A6A6W4W3_9PEZI|nr:uncharacterized protein EJ05DRAFT_539897 [Pseudovirgaria hyperparasitica]KAF2756091.1 hypothetical protein EJ05DRAFT_539897 [Pseudovirgaria hyperparasitica]